MLGFHLFCFVLLLRRRMRLWRRYSDLGFQRGLSQTMHTLSASELLRAWETALAQSPLERPLTLLAAAFPDQSRDELLRQPIGRRNGQLLALRSSLLGNTVTGLATCPHCGERITLDFNLDDAGMRGPSMETQDLTMDEFALTYHAPGTRDLLAVAGSSSADTRRELLQNCIDGARRGETPVPVDQLPEAVLEHVAQSLAKCDPQADVQLALTCPACENAWSVAFDIAGFLWTEITAWARSMLKDIHTIASSYGWSEADILALTPGRRQYYLEMIGT